MDMKSDGKDFVVVCGVKDIIEKAEFSKLLTEAVLNELGEINPNWFEEAFLETNTDVEDACETDNITEKNKVEEKSVKDDDFPNTVLPETETCEASSNFVFGWSPVTQSIRRSQGLSHSTPVRLSLSLGASLGGHDMSWTSSMITPVLQNSDAHAVTRETTELESQTLESGFDDSITFVDETSMKILSQQKPLVFHCASDEISCCKKADVACKSLLPNDLVNSEEYAVKLVTEHDHLPCANNSPLYVENSTSLVGVECKKLVAMTLQANQSVGSNGGQNSMVSELTRCDGTSDCLEHEKSPQLQNMSMEYKLQKDAICSDVCTPGTEKSPESNEEFFKKRTCKRNVFLSIGKVAAEAMDKNEIQLLTSEYVSSNVNVPSELKKPSAVATEISSKQHISDNNYNTENHIVPECCSELQSVVTETSVEAKCQLPMMVDSSHLVNKTICDNQSAVNFEDLQASFIAQYANKAVTRFESCMTSELPSSSQLSDTSFILACLELEHDYAKTLVWDDDEAVTNVDEFVDYDSHNMYNLTQLMDGVECAAVCLKSLMEDDFSEDLELDHCGEEDFKRNANDCLDVSEVAAHHPLFVNKQTEHLLVQSNTSDKGGTTMILDTINKINQQVSSVKSPDRTRNCSEDFTVVGGCDEAVLTEGDSAVSKFTCDQRRYPILQAALKNSFTSHKRDACGLNSECLNKLQDLTNSPGRRDVRFVKADEMTSTALMSTSDGTLGHFTNYKEFAVHKATDVNPVCGFVTASGKTVSISGVAIEKAKQAFVDEQLIVDAQEASLFCEDKDTTAYDGTFVHNRNNMDLSCATLLKANENLHECDRNMHAFNASSKVTEILPVQSVVQQELKSDEDKSAESLSEPKSSVPVGVRFQGFSTASGKNVSVSEKSLEKARQLYKEDMTSWSHHGDSTSAQQIPLSTKPVSVGRLSVSCGFSTASGKTVNVSKEALEKAIKSYEGCCDGDGPSEKNGFNVQHETSSSDDICVAAGGDNPLNMLLGAKVKSECRGVKRSHSAHSKEPIKKSSRIASDHIKIQSACKLDDANVLPFENSKGCGEKMFEISEDSLDAAEALIAMSNSSLVKCSAIKDTALLCKNISTLAKTKCLSPPCEDANKTVNCRRTLNLSDTEISTEILQSTFAFLEDEFSENSLTENSCIWNSRNESSVLLTNNELNVTPQHEKINTCPLSTNVISPNVPFIALDPRRTVAVDKQLALIAEKSRMKIYPVTYTWYKEKVAKGRKIPLKRFCDGFPLRRIVDVEAIKLGVKKSTLNICSSNAETFCFPFDEYFKGSCDPGLGIIKIDNAELILDQSNLAGKEEFYRAVVCSDGVDPKLVSRAWVYNHYRWIVWKFAAMEISFPKICAGRFLTPERVMRELLFRVNHEVDFGKRSALKRIVERDDTPLKTMVLCVASICRKQFSGCMSELKEDKTLSKTEVFLEVTDGWYSMNAMLDDPLKNLVEQRKICIGQKLIIHGAELVGSSEACSPLEIPSDLFLKISFNSCRRSRWHAKLGYCLSPFPFLLPLNSLVPGGGLVGCADVIVARIYPLQYLEKHSDSSCHIITEKMNELKNSEAETERRILIDKLVADVQTAVELQESSQVSSLEQNVSAKCFTADQIKVLLGGEEIAVALKNAADPSFVESCLSSSQKESLLRYNLAISEQKQTRMQSKLEKLIQMKKDHGDFPAEREVVPMLKIRVVGIHPKDLAEKTSCILTIWRPTDGCLGFFEEGKCVQFEYLMTENKSARRELSLKSTKMTKFKEIPSPSLCKLSTAFYKPRSFTDLDEISVTEFRPIYGELDVIGIIVTVGKLGLPPCSKFDIAYLANSEQIVVGIKFWGGLKAFDVETILQPGSFVVCYNLEWRCRVKSPIQYIHASELSAFTQRPKDIYARQQVDALRDKVKNVETFVEETNTKISGFLKPTSSIVSSPLPFQSKPSMLQVSPLVQCRQSNFVLMKASDPEDQNASNSLRKISYLQRVAAPPPLCALRSPNSLQANSKYKVPLAKSAIN